MLEIALACLARGWWVFPCTPRTKEPLSGLVPHGKNDASNDEALIRHWWKIKPDANVAIACGASGLAVLDCDNGLDDQDAFSAWSILAGLPVTYTVHTGRRFKKGTQEPEFGVQLYYDGTMPEVAEWSLVGGSGQVKSLGGYVMAAGCIHPDSGKRYEVLVDIPLAPLPDIVRGLKTLDRVATVKSGEKIPEGAGRHDALMRVACSMRSRGLDGDTIHAAMIPINEAMCEVPISDKDLETMCSGIEGRYPAGELEPIITLGGGKKPVDPPKEPDVPKDWRTKYHTFDEMDNAPEPVFLIDRWLQKDSITAIAAPVGQRKSLIALNVAWALCTGEPLFDYFKVTHKPARVLYLCPEMGLISFTKRMRDIGLLHAVKDGMLFCRTMSIDEEMTLEELTAEELDGAVVIVDTAIRYLEGDENKSEDMRVFARSIFRLMKCGATVVLLHHSAKGTKEASELTLENAMRGSGELGAFLYCCWATRMQDPTDEYKTASYLRNVKQRDFESKPFEVTCGPDCRLHIVADPETTTVTLNARAGGVKADKDGKDDARRALIKANPKLSNVKMAALFKDNGMPRCAEWIRTTRAEMLQDNGGMMP